jgi:hypothetical protein
MMLECIDAVIPLRRSPLYFRNCETNYLKRFSLTVNLHCHIIPLLSRVVSYKASQSPMAANKGLRQTLLV